MLKKILSVFPKQVPYTCYSAVQTIRFENVRCYQHHRIPKCAYETFLPRYINDMVITGTRYNPEPGIGEALITQSGCVITTGNPVIITYKTEFAKLIVSIHGKTTFTNDDISDMLTAKVSIPSTKMVLTIRPITNLRPKK